MVTFHDPQSHPDRYQRIKDDEGKPRSLTPQAEIEKFIAGKTYMLAFQLPDMPGEVWAADPWDAEYLGISKKELSQSAYVLRARGLIELDTSLSFARPSDKLVTTGWPAAADPNAAATAAQVFALSSLPKKEELVADLRNSLSRHSEIALIFADLEVQRFERHKRAC
jgi:hypothetical protein